MTISLGSWLRRTASPRMRRRNFSRPYDRAVSSDVSDCTRTGVRGFGADQFFCGLFSLSGLFPGGAEYYLVPTLYHRLAIRAYLPHACGQLRNRGRRGRDRVRKGTVEGHRLKGHHRNGHRLVDESRESRERRDVSSSRTALLRRPRPPLRRVRPMQRRIARQSTEVYFKVDIHSPNAETRFDITCELFRKPPHPTSLTPARSPALRNNAHAW